MPDIQTYGVGVISDEQARFMALSLFTEIKQYIAEHRNEFEEWVRGTDDDRH